MMPSINQLLTDFTSVILGFCVVIGLYSYKQIESRPIRLLIIYLAFGTVVDIALACFHFPGMLIRGMYCITLPIEYIIYAYMFKDKIGPNRTVYLLLLASGVGISVLGMYQLLYNLDSYSAATVVFRVVGILTMVLVLFYFRALFITNDIIYFTRDPLFWIATCLLVFFAGNVIPTGFYHFFYSHSKSFAPKIFIVNMSLNILRYVCFSHAFFLAKKQNAK